MGAVETLEGKRLMGTSRFVPVLTLLVVVAADAAVAGEGSLVFRDVAVVDVREGELLERAAVP